MIELNFTKKGNDFKKVWENNNWFLYQVTSSGGAVYYEVFKKKLVTKNVYQDGKWVRTDEKELRYPGDNDFGSWAWTYPKKTLVMKIITEKGTEQDILEYSNFLGV